MTLWFTADTHFGHENIIRHCQRPFRNVAEMDEVLVERWNAVVCDDDEVWHLGDFAYRCGPRRMADIFDRLKGGRRHLIKGNHDRRHTLALPWSSVGDYAEIKVGTVDLILFHYALREWNRSNHGSWSLFGHSHGRLPAEGLSCDVGVDCWDFRPVSLREIAARLRLPLAQG